MSQRTIIQIESSRPPAGNSSSHPTALGTRAPEGALAGAAMCITLVGAVGWLAGIGVLAIPGIGQLTAQGPGLAALCGIVVGATIGGFAGCLVGRRIPDLHRPPILLDESKFSLPGRARDRHAGEVLKNPLPLSE